MAAVLMGTESLPLGEKSLGGVFIDQAHVKHAVTLSRPGEPSLAGQGWVRVSWVGAGWEGAVATRKKGSVSRR